jgi:hypothetical protein
MDRRFWHAALLPLSFLALSCGTSQVASTPEPVAPPEPVPPPVVEAPVCLDPLAFSFPAIHVEGDTVEYCGGGDTVCVVYDLGTGALSRREPPTEAVFLARSVRTDVELLDAEAIKSAGRTHELCAPAGSPCKTVKLGEGRAHWRSHSADGKLTVYSMEPDDEAPLDKSKMRFLVFDRLTGRLIKTHVFQDGSLRCGGARFVGNLLLVAVDVCAGPGGEAWFMDPRTGRKLANVGGEGPFGQYDPAVWVHDKIVAVLEQTGTRFALHDVETGAFLRFVEPFPMDELMPEPYGNGLWMRPDGDALLTLTGEAVGVVLRIDGQTFALKARYDAPRCPRAE